jgi:hypothetical protein
MSNQSRLVGARFTLVVAISGAMAGIALLAWEFFETGTIQHLAVKGLLLAVCLALVGLALDRMGASRTKQE